MNDRVLTDSLVPALPYASVATRSFEEAAVGVSEGRLSDAEQMLIGLDDQLLRDHFRASIAEGTRRDATAPSRPVPSLPVVERNPARMPGRTAERTIYPRDGWHCRWCGTPVIAKGALRRMSNLFTSTFPYGNRDSARHGLILCCGVSLDHVVPHSAGGINDENNLVTACWACQFGRSNFTNEHLRLADPKSRPPRLDGNWAGCAWFDRPAKDRAQSS